MQQQYDPVKCDNLLTDAYALGYPKQHHDWTALKSDSDGGHKYQSALFEVRTFIIFRELGFTVDANPPPSASGKTPDLIVSDTAGNILLAECKLYQGQYNKIPSTYHDLASRMGTKYDSDLFDITKPLYIGVGDKITTVSDKDIDSILSKFHNDTRNTPHIFTQGNSTAIIEHYTPQIFNGIPFIVPQPVPGVYLTTPPNDRNGYQMKLSMRYKRTRRQHKDSGFPVILFVGLHNPYNYDYIILKNAVASYTPTNTDIIHATFILDPLPLLGYSGRIFDYNATLIQHVRSTNMSPIILPSRLNDKIFIARLPPVY